MMLTMPGFYMWFPSDLISFTHPYTYPVLSYCRLTQGTTEASQKQGTDYSKGTACILVPNSYKQRAKMRPSRPSLTSSNDPSRVALELCNQVIDTGQKILHNGRVHTSCRTEATNSDKRHSVATVWGQQYCSHWTIHIFSIKIITNRLKLNNHCSHIFYFFLTYQPS